MDDALKGNAMSTNALENAKKNLEAKVKMYEDKLPHLENSLVSRLQRLVHGAVVEHVFIVPAYSRGSRPGSPAHVVQWSNHLGAMCSRA